MLSAMSLQASASSGALSERYVADSLVACLETAAFVDRQESGMLLDRLSSIAAENADDRYLALLSLYAETRTAYIQSIRNPQILEKCRLVAGTFRHEDDSLSAMMSLTMAMACHNNGEYATALPEALRSLDMFRQQGNDRFTERSLRVLAAIFLRTNNVSLSLQYARMALDLTKEGEKEYYMAYIVYYSTLAQLPDDDDGNRKEALAALLKICPELEKMGDKRLLTYLYYYLGYLDKGSGYLQKCLDFVNENHVDNCSIRFGLIHTFATVSASNGDYAKALKLAYEAEEIGEKNDSPLYLSHSLPLISDIYYKTGHVDSAYHYLNRYVQIRDQIASKSRTIESYEAYTAIFMDSMQKELVAAGRQRRTFSIMILSIAAVLIMLVLLVILLIRNRRSMSLFLEKERGMKQQLADKLEAQERELSTHALLLYENAERLRQISECLTKIPESSESIGRIEDIIHQGLTADKAWETFMMHFNNVHPDFFEKLKNRCGSLTENNLRLCAYLRIGLSSKQIAQIMQIASDNVRISVYRLKKKLQIGESGNLYDFLRGL